MAGPGFCAPGAAGLDSSIMGPPGLEFKLLAEFQALVGNAALLPLMWWAEAPCPPKLGGQRRCVHQKLVDKGAASTIFWWTKTVCPPTVGEQNRFAHRRSRSIHAGRGSIV